MTSGGYINSKFVWTHEHGSFSPDSFTSERRGLCTNKSSPSHQISLLNLPDPVRQTAKQYLSHLRLSLPSPHVQLGTWHHDPSRKLLEFSSFHFTPSFYCSPGSLQSSPDHPSALIPVLLPPATDPSSEKEFIPFITTRPHSQRLKVGL